METLRTPGERFHGLVGFDLEPRYADISEGQGGSLRISYAEDGPADAPLVLLLHGEPTWSYLYRDVIDVLTRAGLRSVAVDLVGFGRSDKPTSASDPLVRWSRGVGASWPSTYSSCVRSRWWVRTGEG